MTARLEMLQVARVGPGALGEAASRRVRAFIEEQFVEGGGVQDRGGEPDLYYTVFGIESLIALRAEPPVAATASWLEEHGDGATLDVIHHGCLARCRSALDLAQPAERVERMAARIESFRASDGGYANGPSQPHGNVYHSFVCHSARQDLGLEAADDDRLAASIFAMRTKDGSWANQPGHNIGVTTVCAAAVTLLAQLGHDAPPEAADWLLQQVHPKGGFIATPGAPIPDLLSTAVALHALSILKADLDPIRDPCLDFLDTLWNGTSFCGHWADDHLDSEYTFYALLALGHLSV